MLVFDTEGVESKVLYTLYWRRPEETRFTRFSIWQTEKARDRNMADIVRFGLVCQADTLSIPAAEAEVTVHEL